MTSALALPRAPPQKPLVLSQQQHQSPQQQQQQQGPPPPPPSRPRRRKRSPNWDEFYRNGYPTDIITIDDDTPPLSTHLGISSDSSAVASRASAASGSLSASASSTSISGAPPSIGRTHFSTGATVTATTATQTNAKLFEVDTLSSKMTVKRRRYPALADVADLTYANMHLQASGNDASPASFNGSADIGKRRRVDYYVPKKPVKKAEDIVVKTVHDPFGARVNSKIDDDDGHYIIVPDTDLTSRYKITKLLGQGTFGKVAAAYDKEQNKYCAIKIIRAVQKYRDASRIELRVLRTLSMYDQQNLNRCIHLRDCFDYRNHICIVTDLLSISVFDFLKANDFSPFPLSHIQRFAKQLLTSVAFLHELNLIHTDLKPENILLVDNGYTNYPCSKRNGELRRVLNDTTIHLIDFGSATFDDEYHSSVVSTRHYRAPEIILGLGWSFPCDMWSIGCILVEFYTGEALFQTHDNMEHLAMMEVVVGRQFDRAIAKSSNRQAQKYFLRNGRLDYPNAQTSKTSKKYVKQMKTLDDTIAPTDAFHKLFLDLLRRIFVYDPAKRLTAKEALAHPWFRESIFDEGSSSSGAR
ncbi:kinase-like domain-containing protein [Limtongia smithiae]|uniref:kinase-like domain-containing protein n=1 Tax=Limtongia smithiae TaxID=1125753 RepID=UPI0034CDB448